MRLNSASELEYHLMLACYIQVVSNKTFTPLASQVVEVRKMLHGLSVAVSQRMSARPSAARSASLIATTASSLAAGESSLT